MNWNLHLGKENTFLVIQILSHDLYGGTQNGRTEATRGVCLLPLQPRGYQCAVWTYCLNVGKCPLQKVATSSALHTSPGDFDPLRIFSETSAGSAIFVLQGPTMSTQNTGFSKKETSTTPYPFKTTYQSLKLNRSCSNGLELSQRNVWREEFLFYHIVETCWPMVRIKNWPIWSPCDHCFPFGTDKAPLTACTQGKTPTALS